MIQTLLLLDYENVPKVDLSVLDEGYRAIIFVGNSQVPPKAARRKESAHRFRRVDFQKIEGAGRNALDFHIAFHLGRLFETSPGTECVVIAKDKGYDPLLAHLNKNGMKCRRVESWDALVSERCMKQLDEVTASSTQRSNATMLSRSELTVCPRCNKSSTIEHHGGRWCSNCGCFAAPPNPELLPSAHMNAKRSDQRPYRARLPWVSSTNDRGSLECSWCHQLSDMTGGIYDDGEWMCGQCVAGYAT